MTRFPHDQFAKDYLEQLLSPIGNVQTSRNIAGEVREVDVLFIPTSISNDYLLSLGLLGRFATTSAVFEPFRNAVTPSQIRSCLSKLFDLYAELERRARRDSTSLNPSELPRLWILTPTASTPLLDSFGALGDEQNRFNGLYFLHEAFRTAIVVIHQLPRTPQTLWLRLLGKGRVQQQAIEEITALPEDSQRRQSTLELLYNLQANLQANQDQKLDTEERELIMALAPLYRQQLDAALQRGMEQGLQQGIQQGQRLIIENLLQTRLGQLTPTLTALITPLSALPPQQLTPFLLQLSQLENSESGIQQAQHFIVENLLQIRFGELDEQLTARVTSLLALPPQELSQYLLQLSQVSREQLLARFP
ncbi:MAG: flagellar assembly protein H [Coleofasciculus chthonoplastes F3-SA18-01]|uniref:flagellar assembly protein H n=1 Tax=Coleofasciculus chthonoplastes TaxID=64178 RepID=UPI0032F98E40